MPKYCRPYEGDSRRAPKQLLFWYLSLAKDGDWDSDNIGEIGHIVDSIIDITKKEILEELKNKGESHGKGQ